MKALSFADIRLVPAVFSRVSSRKMVNTNTVFGNQCLQFPIIASNMDSVFSPELAAELHKNGGVAVMHRFMPVEQSATQARQLVLKNIRVWGSVGVGEIELQRALSYVYAGIDVIVLDVANAAAQHVADFYKRLDDCLPPRVRFIVGNFATAAQIDAFCKHVKDVSRIIAMKVGIGMGSACETTVVTGMGLPTVTTILDCVKNKHKLPIIQDGGIKNSGDFCKALALGASAVMVGKLFAQCAESGGAKDTINGILHTRYRGSASAESYEVQGKVASWRASEGAGGWLPVTSTVKELIEQFSGGLRSCMSYSNAFNLKELQKNTSFVEVTDNGKQEGEAHGFRK